MSLSENALINRISPSDSLNGGFINTKKLTAFADEIIRRFDVVTKDAQTSASALSGGNLQKYIVGRAPNPKSTGAAYRQPDLGVDVAAAAFIRREIQNLSDTGCAVLVISEDLDEMFFLCDEIAVINKGRLARSIQSRQSALKMSVAKWLSAAQFNTANAVFSFCPSAD